MGLGNIKQTRKHYLSINGGKVIIDKGNGKKDSFSFERVYLKEYTLKTEPSTERM